MRHNIFRLLTEEQCKAFFRDKTDEEIREMIYGFNKRVAQGNQGQDNPVTWDGLVLPGNRSED